MSPTKDIIRFEGDLEFDQILDRIEKLSAAELEEAVLEALDPIRAAAVANAPRDTGELARSINVQITSKSADFIEAEVGSSAFYASFIELGTAKAAAQPFLRPATDANQKKSSKILADAVEKIIQGKRG